MTDKSRNAGVYKVQKMTTKQIAVAWKNIFLTLFFFLLGVVVVYHYSVKILTKVL